VRVSETKRHDLNILYWWPNCTRGGSETRWMAFCLVTRQCILSSISTNKQKVSPLRGGKQREGDDGNQICTTDCHSVGRPFPTVRRCGGRHAPMDHHCGVGHSPSAAGSINNNEKTTAQQQQRQRLPLAMVVTRYDHPPHSTNSSNCRVPCLATTSRVSSSDQNESVDWVAHNMAARDFFSTGD
jgi:hypothetical protein